MSDMLLQKSVSDYLLETRFFVDRRRVNVRKYAVADLWDGPSWRRSTVPDSCRKNHPEDRQRRKYYAGCTSFGRVIRKVVPSPGLDLISIFP